MSGMSLMATHVARSDELPLLAIAFVNKPPFSEDEHQPDGQGEPVELALVDVCEADNPDIPQRATVEVDVARFTCRA
jgi:hypothetical protein